MKSMTSALQSTLFCNDNVGKIAAWSAMHFLAIKTKRNKSS